MYEQSSQRFNVNELMNWSENLWCTCCFWKSMANRAQDLCYMDYLCSVYVVRCKLNIYRSAQHLKINQCYKAQCKHTENEFYLFFWVAVQKWMIMNIPTKEDSLAHSCWSYLTISTYFIMAIVSNGEEHIFLYIFILKLRTLDSKVF